MGGYNTASRPTRIGTGRRERQRRSLTSVAYWHRHVDFAVRSSLPAQRRARPCASCPPASQLLQRQWVDHPAPRPATSLPSLRLLLQALHPRRCWRWRHCRRWRWSWPRLIRHCRRGRRGTGRPLRCRCRWRTRRVPCGIVLLVFAGPLWSKEDVRKRERGACMCSEVYVPIGPNFSRAAKSIKSRK